MNKSGIVHLLADRLGLQRCLVIRTPLTGPDCAVDPKRFDAYSEWHYKCPESHRIGGVEYDPILFYSSKPEIVLLDPWHWYEESTRDLLDAWRNIPPGGAIVCHDCWPREEITEKNGWDACLRGGEWSGETFKAWMDFTSGTGLYCTVDSDYGCGVMVKGSSATTPDYKLRGEWFNNKSWKFLAGEGKSLLNLLDVSQFVSWVKGLQP